MQSNFNISYQNGTIQINGGVIKNPNQDQIPVEATQFNDSSARIFRAATLEEAVAIVVRELPLLAKKIQA